MRHSPLFGAAKRALDAAAVATAAEVEEDFAVALAPLDPAYRGQSALSAAGLASGSG